MPGAAMPFGVEVVHVADRRQQIGPGDRVRITVVRLQRVVDGPGEDLAGDERLGAETVGRLVVLEESVERRVRSLVLEGKEVQPHVLALDRRAALLDEALVVALHRAVPDLDGVDTLNPRLLAHQHGALVVEAIATVGGLVRLQRLRDLRVVGLDRRTALAELGVTRDAHLVLGPEDRHRRCDRRRQVLRDHEHAVQRVRAELVEVVVVLRVPDVERTWAGAAVGAARIRSASVANDSFEHCCATSVWRSAISGRPVTAPALSLQVSMGVMSCRNSAVVPTRATEFPHAAATALVASVGLSLESPCLTTTLRHARPPLELMYSPHAFMPSHEPLNRPGRIELFTSATTVTVIVVGETPTSLAFSGVSHLPGLAAVVVVSPPRPSPPEESALAATSSPARAHQNYQSRREDAPTQPHSFSPGVHLTGRSVRTLCTAVDLETGRVVRERSAPVRPIAHQTARNAGNSAAPTPRFRRATAVRAIRGTPWPDRR